MLDTTNRTRRIGEGRENPVPGDCVAGTFDGTGFAGIVEQIDGEAPNAQYVIQLDGDFIGGGVTHLTVVRSMITDIRHTSARYYRTDNGWRLAHAAVA